MLNNVKQGILVGAGTSIKEGISLGLFDKIKDKFIISLNYSYKDLPNATFNCFVDYETFYKKELINLKDLPLIIGQYNFNLLNISLPNTILLKHASKYDRTLTTGVYNPFLCGSFALSVAIYLLDVGEIFLLGYDFGTLPINSNSKSEIITINNQQIEVEDITDKFPLGVGNQEVKSKNIIHQNGRIYRIYSHYYQDRIDHRGVGKVSFYTEQKAKQLFDVYKDETKVKIWNVSPQSKIPTFVKIDYPTFFSKLDNEVYDQNQLRLEIKNKLKELPKEVLKICP